MGLVFAPFFKGPEPQLFYFMLDLYISKISYYISVDGSDTVCTCFYNKGYRWSDVTKIGTSLVIRPSINCQPSPYYLHSIKQVVTFIMDESLRVTNENEL